MVKPAYNNPLTIQVITNSLGVSYIQKFRTQEGIMINCKENYEPYIDKSLFNKLETFKTEAELLKHLYDKALKRFNNHQRDIATITEMNILDSLGVSEEVTPY